MCCADRDIESELSEPVIMESSLGEDIVSARAHPSSQDIRQLATIFNQHFNLPIEVIQQIIDQAEYWCCRSFANNTPERIGDETVDSLSSGPLPIPLHSIRKIVITVVSHDQGWSNTQHEDQGTTRNSWTWGEVHIQSSTGQVILDSELYRNLNATMDPQTHSSTFAVAELSLLRQPNAYGTVVTVRNSARFPGWTNFVESCSINVYYSSLDIQQ